MWQNKTHHLDKSLAEEWERLTEPPNIGEELMYLSSNSQDNVGKICVVKRVESIGYVHIEEKVYAMYYLFGRRKELTSNLVWE